MKKHLFVITSLVSLAGAVAVGLFLSAEPSPYGTPQDATSPVSFEMLPETVKNGLVTASGNGVIRRIARRITDDVTVYEADVENNGKLFEITLTATGAVLAITAEDNYTLKDRWVSFEGLPDAVKETLLKAAGNGIIRSIVRTMQNGKVVYAVDISNHDQVTKIYVDDAGNMAPPASAQ